jgi:hypothetical protein
LTRHQGPSGFQLRSSQSVESTLASEGWDARRSGAAAHPMDTSDDFNVRWNFLQTVRQFRPFIPRSAKSSHIAIGRMNDVIESGGQICRQKWSTAWLAAPGRLARIVAMQIKAGPPFMRPFCQSVSDGICDARARLEPDQHALTEKDCRHIVYNRSTPRVFRC